MIKKVKKIVNNVLLKYENDINISNIIIDYTFYYCNCCNKQVSSNILNCITCKKEICEFCKRDLYCNYCSYLCNFCEQYYINPSIVHRCHGKTRNDGFWVLYRKKYN